jgi:hypothetical protein
MNDRIKELWLQAGGHYDSGNQHTWPQYTIDNPEKFAELIVQKCADIGEQYADGNYEVYNNIVKYFGMQEPEE